MTLPLPDKTTSPLVHSRDAEKRRNDRACVFSPRASNYTRKTGPPARVNLGTRFDLWTTRLAGQAFPFYGASSRRNSSVGCTQSIGIAVQRSVGQMIRRGPFPGVPVITWISRPVMILPQIWQ